MASESFQGAASVDLADQVMRIASDVLHPLMLFAVAGTLAVLIGLDRERRGKPAGIRTNVIVSVAAAAFAYTSAHGFGVGDPSRVAAQVVSGIGFLGGGAIFASQGRPQGLTTAAALWGSAAIGLAVGVGQIAAAVAIVIVTFAVLWPLEDFFSAMTRNHSVTQARLAVVCPDYPSLQDVRDRIADSDVTKKDARIRGLNGDLEAQFTLVGAPQALEQLATNLRAMEQVLFISTGSIEFSDQHTH